MTHDSPFAQLYCRLRILQSRVAVAWMAAAQVAVALIGATVWVAALPVEADAAEWSAPPGINVSAQEETLKSRVMRLAESLVGNEVVDVIAHVGYVRLSGEGTGTTPDRVKLPGFNNYIVSSEDRPEIVSEFARVRQVFVVVSDRVTIPPSSLSSDLTRLAGFNPSQGDTLRVITVANSQPITRPGEPMMRQPREPEDEMNGQAEKPEAMGAPPKPFQPPPLAEPQSTAHLMQARRHYFAGDYQGALEQILQAVTVNPKSAEAYSMLGSLYYAMNWKSLAIKYWERSLELDPGNREIEDLVTQIRVQGS